MYNKGDKTLGNRQMEDFFEFQATGWETIKASDVDRDWISKHRWMVCRDSRSQKKGKQDLVYVRRYRNIDLAKQVLERMGDPMGKNDCVRYLNGDRLDCRRENLERVCRRKVLQARRRSNKSSDFLGVCLNMKKRRFTAQLTIGGEQCHLGSYKSELEAARAWNEAALLAYGTDTYFNRVPGWELPEGAEFYPGV